MQTAEDIAQRGGLAAADLSGDQDNGAESQGILNPLLSGTKRFGQHDILARDVGSEGLFLQGEELTIAGIHHESSHSCPPLPVLSLTSSTCPFLSRFTRLLT